MDDKLSQVLCIRVSEATKESLKAAAKRENRKLRSFIRLILENYGK